jgi:hypothetical protein
MQRRTKIIIAVIIFLLLALIAMLFLLKPKAAVPAPQPAPVTTNANANKPAPQGTNTRPAGNINVAGGTNAPAAAKADPKIGLKNTARSFAEMFGSSSTEGNYQNIVDAEYYMSSTVKAWAEKYVSEQRAKPVTGEFSGTTTRALAEEVTSLDEGAGTALVIVNTRRIETGASIASQKVYFQDLTLEFVKVGDAWKVDRFT